ncbi:MAG: DNA-3-methyladenine glycosylase I [candidate division Zixibacteria bacterium]
MKKRCAWAGDDPQMQTYHDEEWGVPLYDDQKLFEFLILEGMQAGLSWSTILKKRDNFRKAFDNFGASKIARYRGARIEKLMNDASIIRNRMKIKAAISGAIAYLKIQNEFDSFHKYIWQFVGGKPIVNKWKTLNEIPVFTPEAEVMSKDLKKRGFNFVGPTICYAFMQATGMVNDHTIDCFRYKQVLKWKRRSLE